MGLPHFKILFVDHAPTDLEHLIDYLAKFGYQVDLVETVFNLLEQLAEIQPDLILLGTPLPDTDSFALCKIIKADPKTEHIPVIFLSSSNESVQIIKGFETGGVDYIVKPFVIPEVLARIQNHLKLAKALQSLQQENIRLKQHIVAQAVETQNSVGFKADVPKIQALPYIKLTLWGSFRLLVNDQERTNFRSDVVRALLAYLVVEGEKTIDRTWLAEFFWPDNLPHTRMNSLRVALHNLRQVLAPLEEVLVTDRRHVMFHTKHKSVWCDVLNTRHLYISYTPMPQIQLERNSTHDKLTDSAFLAGLESVQSTHFQAWRRQRHSFYLTE